MTDVLDRVEPIELEPSDAGNTAAFDARRWGLRVLVGGALAMVGGLAVDGVQHAMDEALIEREGLFTLTNVGHTLILGGAAAVAVGAALALVGPWLYGARDADEQNGPSGPRRILQVAAPVLALIMIAAVASWGSNSSLAQGHPHDETVAAGDGHLHGEMAAAGADPAAEHAHDEPVPVALDAPTQQLFSEQMAQVREVTMRYPTVADARAAGFTRVGPYSANSGAHFLAPYGVAGVMDGASFDLEHPIIYLYSGVEPTSTVVGLMYYAFTDAAPEGFAGPNDHWHEHEGLCLSFGGADASGFGRGDIETPLPIDGGATKADCDAAKGFFLGKTGYMVHVWSAPGWESPMGVFSHDNPMLVCSDGTPPDQVSLHTGCPGI